MSQFVRESLVMIGFVLLAAIPMLMVMAIAVAIVNPPTVVAGLIGMTWGLFALLIGFSLFFRWMDGTR